MLVHHRADLDHWLDQLVGRENITKPQRRIKNLAQRAGVDDAAAVIETLQTRQRRASETKLGVMIVFENVRVACLREIDERSAAAETHRHAEGELMRWRDVDNLRSALFFCG